MVWEDWFGLIALFNSISTFVGYLMQSHERLWWCNGLQAIRVNLHEKVQFSLGAPSRQKKKKKKKIRKSLISKATL